MNRDFAAHVEALFACRACPNVMGTPVTGPVSDARVMLVGQAPGPREEALGRPFAYTAGKRLFAWFERFVGIGEEEFRKRVQISAVIRCFPGRDPKGGDRVPDATEIANCAKHLDREIALLRPELVIAVGTLAAKQLIGTAEVAAVDQVADVNVQYARANKSVSQVGRVRFVAPVYSPQRHRGSTEEDEDSFQKHSSVLLRRPLCLCGEYTGAFSLPEIFRAASRRPEAHGRM